MKIVIVGAGRVGYAIAEQLLTEGHDITVVESDPERAAYISSTLDVIVVEGRANVDQLRIANVADAALLIAATGTVLALSRLAAMLAYLFQHMIEETKSGMNITMTVTV